MQYGSGILRPRSVIEGEHDFALLQEVVSFELLEAEAGPACRVNLDHSRNTERFRVAPTWRPARGMQHGGAWDCTEIGGAVGTATAPCASAIRSFGIRLEAAANFADGVLPDGKPCSSDGGKTVRLPRRRHFSAPVILGRSEERRVLATETHRPPRQLQEHTAIAARRITNVSFDAEISLAPPYTCGVKIDLNGNENGQGIRGGPPLLSVRPRSRRNNPLGGKSD